MLNTLRSVWKQLVEFVHKLFHSSHRTFHVELDLDEDD